MDIKLLILGALISAIAAFSHTRTPERSSQAEKV
jgi:hypothetical protein